MTDWTVTGALGRAFRDGFRIIDGIDPERTANPMAVAMQQSETLRLATAAMVVRRDGSEFSAEDSLAYIHDCRGQVTGAMMVFSRRHSGAREIVAAVLFGISRLPG
jgi:hypothetical protein